MSSTPQPRSWILQYLAKLHCSGKPVNNRGRGNPIHWSTWVFCSTSSTFATSCVSLCKKLTVMHFRRLPSFFMALLFVGLMFAENLRAIFQCKFYLHFSIRLFSQTKKSHQLSYLRFPQHRTLSSAPKRSKEQLCWARSWNFGKCWHSINRTKMWYL